MNHFKCWTLSLKQIKLAMVAHCTVWIGLVPSTKSLQDFSIVFWIIAE